MRFYVFVDLEWEPWPPPDELPIPPIELDVPAETLLKDVIEQALGEAGVDSDQRSFLPYGVRNPEGESPESASFPRAVVSSDGALVWTEGAFDEVSLSDLGRTAQQGLMEGNPNAVYLHHPMYGNGVLPGWEEFITALTAEASIVGIQRFVAIVRSHFPSWRKRGARSPFAFLDLVVTRIEWNSEELARLLRISSSDTLDLLESLGYEAEEGSKIWTLSSNAENSGLRRYILEHHLNRQEEDGDVFHVIKLRNQETHFDAFCICGWHTAKRALHVVRQAAAWHLSQKAGNGRIEEPDD